MVTSAKMPFPGVDNRLFAARWAWRREANGDFVAGFTPKGTRERKEELSASAKKERSASEASARRSGARSKRAQKESAATARKDGAAADRR
jgi:hypothetical protein